LGVAEPLIQTQEPDRIVVQLPGVNDPQRAVEVVGQTAQMNIYLLPQEFTPIDVEGETRFLNTTTKEPVPNEEVIRLSGTPIVTGRDVKPTTTAGFAEGDEAAVFFELQGEGAQRFAQETARGVGRIMPIFLDLRCISAPVIRSPITGGSGQISGGSKTLKTPAASRCS
jgi:preprotein translocase subunit SecD